VNPAETTRAKNICIEFAAVRAVVDTVMTVRWPTAEENLKERVKLVTDAQQPTVLGHITVLKREVKLNVQMIHKRVPSVVEALGTGINDPGFATLNELKAHINKKHKNGWAVCKDRLQGMRSTGFRVLEDLKANKILYPLHSCARLLALQERLEVLIQHANSLEALNY
jgi:hypothetical protein